MDTNSKAIAKRHDRDLSRRPRRLRTIAEKRRIVEDTLEPGASVSVAAQAHDVYTDEINAPVVPSRGR